MHSFLRSALAVAVFGAVPGAQAESLRCNGAIATEGDSKIAVLYKCGPPLLADASCAPVYQAGSPYPVPPMFFGGAVPCFQVEQWLYERGEGNLTATVRFRNGKVESIRYGRMPE